VSLRKTPNAILKPSSLPVVVAHPEKRLQTEQLLRWSGMMTDTGYSGPYKRKRCHKKLFLKALTAYNKRLHARAISSQFCI